MPVYAKLRYLRISPRKVRLVADLLRGKTVEEAQNILHFTIKKAAHPLLKLLKSAIANAKNNFRLEEKNLYISEVLVDEGPKLKRWIARARGRADEIQKKTSHITIVLDEAVKKPEKAKEEEVEEIEKVEKVEKVPKIKKAPKESPEAEAPLRYGAGKLPTGQAKFRPGAEIPKTKKERGIKRILRRTAF